MIPEISGDFLRWLRGFYYVATLGSVSQAAKAMQLKQSAVSYHIKTLESELNTVLFVRLKNQVKLTPVGEKLLQWAVVTFDTIAALQSEVTGQGGVQSEEIHMSCDQATSTHHTFIQILSEFLHEYPHVQLNVNSTHPDKLVNNVEEGTSNFAIIGLHNKPASCTFSKIFESPYFLVTSANQKLKLDTCPTEEQLTSLPQIRFCMDLHVTRMANYFRPSGIEQLIRQHSPLSSGYYPAIMRMVEADLGVAVVDAWSLCSLLPYLPRLKLYSLACVLPPLTYGLLRRSRPTQASSMALQARILDVLSGLDPARLLAESLAAQE